MYNNYKGILDQFAVEGEFRDLSVKETPRLSSQKNKDHFDEDIATESNEMKLGDIFPNLEVETTHDKKCKLHDYWGDSWGILFSHPKDYTPVCTTELGEVVKLEKEFEKRNVKILALSCDSVESHHNWTKDILGYISKSTVEKLPYPVIADPKREIAVKLGMLDPKEKDKEGLPLPCRAVFIVGPDKTLKLSILYPATTGRNFDEILRVIDSLQLTATKKVATPVNWVQGKDCMVLPTVNQEDAKKLFPQHKVVDVPSGKPYLRTTPQPK